MFLKIMFFVATPDGNLIILQPYISTNHLLNSITITIIRRKAWVHIPGQAANRNMKTKIFRLFPLSTLLAKTLRINNIAMKKILKNLSFGVAFKQ